jgi:hypothetical protein
MADVVQRSGRRISVSKEVTQLLDSNAPGVNAAIRDGLYRKMHVIRERFPAIPLVPEVIRAAKRWVALDMLRKDDAYHGIRISQKEYDAEVKDILELLSEKTERKERMDRLTGAVTDIQPLAVKRKSRFILELFIDRADLGNHAVERSYAIERSARKWVAADMLLNSGKITPDVHEEMVSLINDEIRESMKHLGFIPPSSNASYGQRSSGPLGDRRRTT